MEIKFVYTALQVRNINKAERFYTKILGMKRVARKLVKETKGEMCILKLGDAGLELNKYTGQKNRRGNNLDHLSFKVDNLESLIKKVKSKHVHIYDYIETDRWKRCFIADPDGNWIELYQHL